MESEKLNFAVDYSNISVFKDYNINDLQYPLVLSVPHSGTYFPPEFLAQVNSDEKTIGG